MRKTSLLLFFSSALLLLGAGCITIGGGGTSAASDGGIFKTADKGERWLQKTAVATAGERRTISGSAVAAIVQDPQDPGAIYIGTAEQGMWHSYDGGESWRETPGLNRGRVPSLAVDPKDKCTIFVATENKLVKSTDCSRSWSTAYIDTKIDRQVSAVAIDSYDPRVVWIGLTSGDVLKSTDGGVAWVLSRHLDDGILRLMIHGGDSRRAFAVTRTGGVWRTDDGGANWKDLRENIRNAKPEQLDPGDLTDFALAASEPDTVILAAKYGLLRSRDAGENWEPIPLVTPPNAALIYALAIDPQDANNIYYATATTFYKTANGGTNWVPKKLPTSRAATALTVDRSNPAVLYMGVTKLK